MDDLYDQPELYDLVSPRDPDMERFYLETAGGVGRSVLELACGTGRLTVPLARSGAKITGGDLSEGMLARARVLAEKAGVTPRFATLDMRDFELGQRFDRIVIAANSLLHLTGTGEFARFLAAAARHLESDGLLAFDIFVPSAHLLSLPAGERRWMGDFSHPQLGLISTEETVTYDPIAQISHADWYWSAPGLPDFRHTKLDMRQIYPQELLLLLERGGFRMVERFGDFDRSPLTTGSIRQVVICRLA